MPGHSLNSAKRLTPSPSIWPLITLRVCVKERIWLSGKRAFTNIFSGQST